ncbi:transcription initiation factor TFIID subunit 4-like isoform X2 [Syngnathoides biaculeatus]|uniref:transcription initiation factor TFIID subunit 4-like isoform X2 n=1 Tax=Syngnathoides biaculeatus TaxID=300417 RepID=UPI002ADDC0D7|nr:transcription initiation factor TFIID subunit 4-like isoform X2 [Syngnathoides biaculeatus]
MAGASDPLEDMLSNEVDEKAVSDLVGSLESQLGDSEGPPAAAAAGKRDVAPAVSASHFSGKVRDQEPPQQGHPGAAVKLLAPSATGQLLPPPPPSSCSSSSSGGDGGGGGGGVANPQTFASVPSSTTPVPAQPGVQTLSGQTTASYQRVVQAQPGGRTPSPGSQSFNGAAGAVRLLNSAGATPPATTSGALVVMAAPANFHQEAEPAAPAPPAALQQRLPSAVVNAAHNGLEPKAGPPGPPVPSVPSGTPSPSQAGNPSKMPMAAQPASANPVILTGAPPSLGPPGIKPAVNGLGQARAAVAVPAQRAGPAVETVRPVAPQPPLAVRPQQQATIQLPPGFTMPAGMVLVRVETGHLVMVPQQVLAQAQAKTQQSPGTTAVPQRPTAPAAIRAPVTPQTIRLATPPQAKPLQSPSSSSCSSPSTSSSVQAITVTSGAPFSAKTPLPLKPQTAATTVAVSPAAPPASGAAPAGARAPAVSQEMQENVKKCKNFLATLIKLVSNNSPSPDTSKNVKALVQDLIDAKIEPEEFTSRLQAELNSSPQPYLIPFLKKSLPTLRQSLLSSQQSLTPPPTCAPPVAATAAVRPRLPVGIPGVRMNAPLATATLAAGRGCVQTLRAPLVVGVRTPGTLMRGPAAPVAKSVVTLVPPANQKKLGDPGGGTFRDDDDINDVASMAGVNLSEENARILATSSGLVGTKIRSCKDEAFLPAGLLHRRLVDTARRLGVSEVPLEVVNLVSHATQSRLRSLLEKVSALAQHRSDAIKDEEHHEQTSDVRSQLRFFEQLERLEKQRKDEQEREILLKAAKSRARQEDPEQARLKQKAKEMQQQELAQMRQRDANLTALAAIGPRKKRKMDSPGGAAACTEVSSGASASGTASSRQPWRQRIIRVNLRDLIVCLEQDGSTARSLTLYKALLKFEATTNI